MRVLIAEDDINIRNGLVEVLEREGYATAAAANGTEALDAFARLKPAFVLLDIMMPGVNGYDVCREIRKRDGAVPIIFISAKSEEIDRVLGLELGADDFVMKPFGIREVVARIRAVTRRVMHNGTGAASSTFVMGDLEVIPRELRARREGVSFDLSLREVKILELLHARRGQVVDRDTFFNVCWGLDYAPNSRTLDQHIAQLRKKVERDVKEPLIIRTVHGAGYRFDG